MSTAVQVALVAGASAVAVTTLAVCAWAAIRDSWFAFVIVGLVGCTQAVDMLKPVLG